MSKKHKRKISHQTSRPIPVQAARTTEFNPNYSTTKRELRRIGILAGSFVAVLIVLAIFQEKLLALFVK